ncbi:hypothetical protein SFRURICE_005192 [Spodoptera frugiperda]|nr:hypothetical protein SFRURICE_005192 [Spodoptera frugiperda]
MPNEDFSFDEISIIKQLFVCSTNCCFGSGCHVNVNLYVCKCTHDTGENASVKQCLIKKNHGRVTSWRATCNGFYSRMEQVFVCFTDCCFGSGYPVIPVYVCKRTHDTGENPSVEQRFLFFKSKKKN